jgi:universal stress protein E
MLVVVDPTAKEHPVIARAAWLAGKTGAALELFICDYDQYLAGERFFDSTSLDKARKGLIQRHVQRLRKLAQPLLDQGLKVSVDVAWDYPLHEGIVRRIAKAKPDLVLKDTHYHPLIRRSLFSNTDWNLIRSCPVPLMLVKPSAQRAIKTVIAAVDPVHERDKPADLDHKIITTAQELAAAVGGDMHVVHAFDPAPAYAVSADAMSFPIAEPINELIAGLRQRHKNALAALLASYSIPEKHVHLGEGDTREVLIASVEELHADLVVMGAVARGAIKRMLLGSTAELVLDHVPCDLLILKPGAKPRRRATPQKKKKKKKKTGRKSTRAARK